MKPKEDQIAIIISKMMLTGKDSISAEEKVKLSEWRKGNEAREKLYRQLTDPEYLKIHLQQLQAIDCRKPLRDMQQRIANSQRPKRQWHRVGLLVAASVLVLVALGVALFKTVQPAKNDKANTQILAVQTISHGTTKATLSLSDGQAVQLGSDSKENARRLSQLDTEHQQLRLNTPRGGEFHIRLSDGTEVWLNAGSQLSYPNKFEGDERHVILVGEAYFKVKKDARHPFVVEAGGETVTVHGTEFNINAYPDRDKVYTTLVSGSITLTGKGENHVGQRLKPGQQAVLDENQQEVTVRHVDVKTTTSWREGRFVFNDRTLGDIMLELSRWYDFDYTLTDARLRSTVFMGSVPRYAHFSEVLRILEMSGGISFKVEGRHVEVMPRP
ncbi:MAG: FecR family protein [Prevotella sp.]|jgi:transmembrane sensor